MFCLVLMNRAQRPEFSVAFGGIVLQWLSFLVLLAGSGRGFRFLSRLSFAAIAGSAPFTVYSLYNFHGCLVTFEDNLTVLIFLFIAIPLLLRFILGPYAEGLAARRELARLQLLKQPRLDMPRDFQQRIFREWSPGETREPSVILWSGLGPEALLTRCGRVLVNPDCWENDPTIRPASEEEFHMYIRARAGLSCPELYDLVPSAPKDSLVCSRCGGSGWNSAPNSESGKTFCNACEARGWSRKS